MHSKNKTLEWCRPLSGNISGAIFSESDPPSGPAKTKRYVLYRLPSSDVVFQQILFFHRMISNYFKFHARAWSSLCMITLRFLKIWVWPNDRRSPKTPLICAGWLIVLHLHRWAISNKHVTSSRICHPQKSLPETAHAHFRFEFLIKDYWISWCNTVTGCTAKAHSLRITVLVVVAIVFGTIFRLV